MDVLMVMEMIKRLDTETLETTSAEDLQKIVGMIYDNGIEIDDFFRQAD